MEFYYMLLSRYVMDVEYYLGRGNRNPQRLYKKDYDKHIRKMIELWKSLPQKPQWLKATKLIEYKKALTQS